MMPDYSAYTDGALIAAAHETRLGLARASAIDELARRALADEALLPAVCAAITTDHALGFHHLPIGWLAADTLFLSGHRPALAALLAEMLGWSATEQADLVRHWARGVGIKALTARLQADYSWTPAYVEAGVSTRSPGLTP
jgi:hypothetical protein